MGRIEIYDEPVKDDVLRLKLERRADGVCVVSTDANGRIDYRIATIRDDGTLRLCEGICSDIPVLQLNDEGHIKLEE